MADQLEEYRMRMQQRYSRAPSNNNEELLKKRQEEEKQRREQQLREDEELAKRLQSSYAGTPVYPPPPQQYRPPEYVPPSQYPPQQYPPQYPPHYPPQYPPAAQSVPNIPAYNNQRRANSNFQSAPNSVGEGCLPQINDKCCGINTQFCVLTSAIAMTIGIIVSLLAIST